MSDHQPKPPRIRIDIPANLEAIYSNNAIVNHTPSEFILDFMQLLPNDPRGRVLSRVVMTPLNVKLLINLLQQNMARYEEQFGEIKVEIKPSLADKLFDSVKPESKATDTPDKPSEEPANDEKQSPDES